MSHYYVRNIEVKGYTANWLIIKLLQNGFNFGGPAFSPLFLRLCFAFCYLSMYVDRKFRIIFYIFLVQYTIILQYHLDNIYK